MVEIAKRNNVSERTIYRYKEYKRSSGIYADVLSSLQLMQDYGVNLICVEDGIDSSKEAGKLLISIIAAVAEMERENIRVQTMAGREQKAREGKWNGGFALYGYRLENGELAQEKRSKNNYRREKVHDPEHAHILSGIPDITIIARIP